MRIELPSPSWADAHRAQEDAHTLTVPEQRPVPALDALMFCAEAEGLGARVEIVRFSPRPLTLTF